ncbi:hypothetical protein KIPB_008874, partial [Kipferlia bialata]|eukprot:g8874.t1
MNTLLALCICLVAAVCVHAEMFDSFVGQATCESEPAMMEETIQRSCYWDNNAGACLGDCSYNTGFCIETRPKNCACSKCGFDYRTNECW